MRLRVVLCGGAITLTVAVMLYFTVFRTSRLADKKCVSGGVEQLFTDC
jgi:hypothetical protein